MKVLVTGATGFVGRHVVPRLLERGHQVTALARDANAASEFSWGRQVELRSFDIHQTRLDPALAEHDAAIHLAWPGLPNYQQLFHFESTLPADYAFLKYLVERGLRHIVVAGTCFEYGMKSGCLPEYTPTDPANPYALAKDTLRRFLQALEAHQPFTLQWARLFYMYGAGQNPNSLVARLDQAIRDREPSFDMSGGEQLRDYLPVEDVARGLVTVAEHREVPGIVNVCSGNPVSVRTLVERRVAESGAKLKLNLGAVPYAAHESMAFWGDNSRLAALQDDEA